MKPQESDKQDKQQPVKAKFQIYRNSTEVEYTQYTVSSLNLNIVEVSGANTETSGGEQTEEPPEDGKSKDVYLDEHGCVQLTPGQAGTTKLALKYQGQVIRNLPITVSSDDRKPYKIVFFDGERITSQITLERFPDYTNYHDVNTDAEKQEVTPSYERMKKSLQVLLKDQYGKMLSWGNYPKATLTLDNHRYAEGVIELDATNKTLSVDVSRDTAASASLPMYSAALRFTYTESEAHRGTIDVLLYVRTKHPDVTVKRNESVTYDPAEMVNYLKYYDLIRNAYTVYINGLQIGETTNPAEKEGYYISSYGPRYDYSTGPSIKDDITFERLSFTISYRARKNGDITWFNAECTDGLGTIQPQAKVVESEAGTENGSTGEATTPSGEQGQNPEPSNPSAQQPGSGTTEPGAAASNAAAASNSVTESGTAA